MYKIYKTHSKKVVLVLLIFCIIITREIVSVRTNYLIIDFLDIGQGDATFIRTPDGQTILVDTGQDSSVISELGFVNNYFKRKIDLVILTHPDGDHIGGMPEILKYYEVSKVMYINIDHESSYFDEVKRKLNELNVDVIDMFNSDSLRIGCCVYINILWPTKEIIKSLSTNDSSISFELVYKDTNFFFGGDLSSNYEEIIAKEDSWLDVDLLKVGHHGSKTSTSESFLEMIKPEVAVISAGKDNKFGHPNKEVLDVLDGKNVKVLRTDLQGRVRVVSDGEEVRY